VFNVYVSDPEGNEKDPYSNTELFIFDCFRIRFYCFYLLSSFCHCFVLRRKNSKIKKILCL